MNVLVWFSGDLRVDQHPALALAQGPVLPFYAADPAFWQQPDRSGRQWDFTAECLAELRRDLAAIGLPMMVRAGPTLDVLAAVVRQFRIGRILVTPDNAGRSDLAQVADWAGRAGITFDIGTEPAGFGPIPAVAGVEPGVIPSARGLGLAEDRCPHRQAGGRSRGVALLDSFLSGRVQRYGFALSGGELPSGSRLSPYLATGALCRREVAATVRLTLASAPPGALKAGLRRFGASLGRTVAPPMVPAFQSGQPAPLQVWRMAETGIPFADAALRHVRATGWLSFPLRAMLARLAGRYFDGGAVPAGCHLASMLTDYRPEIHWPAWAQHAALPLGPFDPVQLGRRLDPGGSFIRAWVPELARLPDDHVHAPWQSPVARGLLGRQYPEPMLGIGHHLSPGPQPLAARKSGKSANADQLALPL